MQDMPGHSDNFNSRGMNHYPTALFALLMFFIWLARQGK